MIFVTVGTVLPFDRLVRAMDDWASRRPETETLAQIGVSTLKPRHMRWTLTMTPGEFDDALRNASLVVAHAGMGSIMAAAGARKPIVILPRRMADKEHTSDHQVHTAKRLLDRPGIYVAESEMDLPIRIQEALDEKVAPFVHDSKAAPDKFIERIRGFLVNPSGTVDGR